MAIIETDGPLNGMACVSIVIGQKETKWLQHAANQLGRPIEDLVRDSAEQAALNWAKECGLLDGANHD